MYGLLQETGLRGREQAGIGNSAGAIYTGC